ncbi:Endochitinase A, partial [Astathelohania contejeani]
WAANYKAAGEGLGLGDALVQDPDQVASDTKLAIDVSTWFWNEKVAKAPGVAEKKFGATIKAINGALECNGSNEEQSKKRWDNYTKIADAWNITDKASEEGCYN